MYIVILVNGGRDKLVVDRVFALGRKAHSVYFKVIWYPHYIGYGLIVTVLQRGQGAVADARRLKIRVVLKAGLFYLHSKKY